VLYTLTVAAYQAERGVAPRLADLNREFPASAAQPRSSGAWNRAKAGQGLPRNAEAPQGLLMRRLEDRYPHVVESYRWPLWKLAGRAPLTLAEIHWLMVELPVGVQRILISVFPNGRFWRPSGDLHADVEMIASLGTFDGLMGLVALLREAEMVQDPRAHGRAYALMLTQLHLLGKAFGSFHLSGAFAQFLRERFASMELILQGAYELVPGHGGRLTQVRFMLPNRFDEEAALRFRADWTGIQSSDADEIWRLWRAANDQQRAAAGRRLNSRR